ncbi:MAG: hypothetical protein BGN96_11315 [Bacteroidales bacterium 45-6]|nr:MAG: hypothetical protein BGN96_11315 [Bacteroidales bacterium 45-6]
MAQRSPLKQDHLFYARMQNDVYQLIAVMNVFSKVREKTEHDKKSTNHPGIQILRNYRRMNLMFL